MKLNILLDADHIEIDDVVWFEDHPNLAATSISEMKPLLARFLYEENGTRMEEGKALEQIGHLSVAQLIDAIKQLRAYLKDLREQAVNPTSGAGS